MCLPTDGPAVRPQDAPCRVTSVDQSVNQSTSQYVSQFTGPPTCSVDPRSCLCLQIDRPAIRHQNAPCTVRSINQSVNQSTSLLISHYVSQLMGPLTCSTTPRSCVCLTPPDPPSDLRTFPVEPGQSTSQLISQLITYRSTSFQYGSMVIVRVPLNTRPAIRHQNAPGMVRSVNQSVNQSTGQYVS